MPKIKITEVDTTGSVSAGAISNTVYIPVASSNTFDPVLCSSLATLAASGATTTTLEYRIAKHLINIGFEVLVEGIGSATSVPDASWTKLQDKGLYDVRFLTNGTLTDTPSGIVSCAATRGDCVALVNINENTSSFDYTATSIRTMFASYATTGAEYVAAFTPWFKTKNSDLLDSDNSDVEATIPAAFGYLFAYANSIKNNPEWYAVAGYDRGVIPELTAVLHDYSSSDIEILQGRSATTAVDLDAEGDNVGFAINPIAYVRPAGYIIYGNRTMHINSASKGLIAQSFLNIRNMVSAIKKTMYEAARKYTFEPNSDTLWINFQSYCTPLLDQMQSGNGLAGYRFIKIATTKKARLKARLQIVPIEAVEDFELEVLLADSLEVAE